MVELKAVAKLDAVHFSQIMTQLKFSGCEVGLLINFNVTRLMEGVRRVIRSYRPSNVSPSATSASSAIESVKSVQ